MNVFQHESEIGSIYFNVLFRILSLIRKQILHPVVSGGHSSKNQFQLFSTMSASDLPGNHSLLLMIPILTLKWEQLSLKLQTVPANVERRYIYHLSPYARLSEYHDHIETRST